MSTSAPPRRGCWYPRRTRSVRLRARQDKERHGKLGRSSGERRGAGRGGRRERGMDASGGRTGAPARGRRLRERGAGARLRDGGGPRGRRRRVRRAHGFRPQEAAQDPLRSGAVPGQHRRSLRQVAPGSLGALQEQGAQGELQEGPVGGHQGRLRAGSGGGAEISLVGDVPGAGEQLLHGRLDDGLRRSPRATTGPTTPRTPTTRSSRPRTTATAARPLSRRAPRSTGSGSDTEPARRAAREPDARQAGGSIAARTRTSLPSNATANACTGEAPAARSSAV